MFQAITVKLDKNLNHNLDTVKSLETIFKVLHLKIFFILRYLSYMALQGQYYKNIISNDTKLKI